MVPAKIGFPMKAKFADFIRFKEAYHDVNTRCPPSRDLVVKPISRARSRHDRQTSDDRQANPMDLRAHPGSLADDITG